jgi:hypothetical protein
MSKARLAISHLRVLRSRTRRSNRAADRADFEVNPHFAAAGLPYSFVQSAPALFLSSAALRRRKKQTRSMALVAASLGPAGVKPNGVELRRLSHFFMTPS